MDLRDYLRVLSRRWRTLTVLALLGTAVGVLATYAATPQYRASATLFVSMQSGSDTNQLNAGNLFAQARVQSYAQVAASPRVTEPVVHALGLHMTPTQLAEKITAEAQPDTVLLRLTVADTRPERAARLSNAVAERFAEVVGGLERPADGQRSPVRLSVTEPAAEPSAPSSPRPAVNLGLGLLAGLALGAGLAVARESLDTSVRSPQALAAVLAGVGGSAVLGSIVHDAQVSRAPVAARDDMHSLRAEAFRRLRTNLQFVDVDRPPKVIAVTSPLSGDGKTSVAVNLAATLAEAGASVCLVDTDLRRPSAACTLGLVRDAGLTTVLIGQAEVHQVLQSAGSFTVLTSGSVPPNPTELLGTGQLRTVLGTLAEEFDHVVVDTAPVLPVADASVIASAVDGYLLVVRAARTGRDQIADALRALQRVGGTVLGTVLNMAPAKGEGGAYGYAYEYRPQHRHGGRLRTLPSLGRGRKSDPPAPVLTSGASAAAGTVPVPASGASDASMDRPLPGPAKRSVEW